MFEGDFSNYDREKDNGQVIHNRDFELVTHFQNHIKEMMKSIPCYTQIELDRLNQLVRILLFEDASYCVGRFFEEFQYMRDHFPRWQSVSRALSQLDFVLHEQKDQGRFIA